MIGMSGAKWQAEDIKRDQDLVDQILDARGLMGPARDLFLSPKEKDVFTDPSQFVDMDQAAKALAEAVLTKKRTAIYSDYDADGATSAGVLGRWLRKVGSGVHDLVVPHRIENGYGPNEGLIREMFDSGTERLFILDSGTVATGALNPLPESDRREIFVIDHHMPSGALPDVGAVVNPNREDQKPGFGHLAACGVTFLLCVGAQRELVRKGVLPKESMRDLLELLDYVAIGTVCDVVPLVGINRAFVSAGIKRINTSPDTPIGALLAEAGRDLSKPITAKDFGFVIGPRLNAPGRIGDSCLASRFLLETDPVEVRRMAKEIEKINADRKTQGEMVTEIAMEQAAVHERPNSCVVVSKGHVGLVGVSAGRMKERLNKPSIVLTELEPGILVGSARSMDGFNIGEAIHEAAHDGILITGGGHAMAGGLRLHVKDLDAFRDRLEERARLSDFGMNGFANEFDLRLSVRDVSVEGIERLSCLQPCGRSNPEPKFIMSGIKILEVKQMSGKHIKLVLDHGRGKKLDAILWNGVGTAMGDRITSSETDELTLAGRFEINEFRDKKSVQMIIEDVLADEVPQKEIIGGP